MAPILNNTSVSYSKLGNYEKAIFYLEKALNIKEKYYGPAHPDGYLLNFISSNL